MRPLALVLGLSIMDERGASAQWFFYLQMECESHIWGGMFGYTFGYRHQFALISASYAKLQMGMGLASSLITLTFPYLS